MIIGITGKSGVGKSTYADKIAKENGFHVIHVDEVSHRVMEFPNVKQKLIETFGEEACEKAKKECFEKAIKLAGFQLRVRPRRELVDYSYDRQLLEQLKPANKRQPKQQEKGMGE